MSNINLSVVASTNCGSGPCPTVYKTDDGRWFVQGFVVSEEIKSKIDLPTNETVVEINLDLVMKIANQLS